MPRGGLDVDKYLERIAFDGPINHDVDTIERLQVAHLSTVPFENLHVFHRRGVRTDVAWSVPKIVERRLG
ncbi:MAG: arylamine N-acetyltransferase, partial [Actinobacteria bacterium]|nr:arylamine N-acetyltransferase [Actinomycetota bacterium]